ncbi:hypothetical protein M3610_20750 [Neobacillus sp. MER 74]|uniref:hypothetical protein n=1 Tax=Neobacillus sp. MER 74 TaxID=2939566 RepID=UPI00203FB2A9|nr:hypothetical protein [Neobacillus sp. MER 74]MCM3117705.1 hypothetical protein [Neobacillus sp. MER 74]
MLIADFIIDLIGALIEAMIPTPKSKLEKNINELKEEEWFADLDKDVRYNYIIWHNNKVKRFLKKPENVKILKSSEWEREKFIQLVIKEHKRFVGIR